MTKKVDFIFDVASPNAYFCHKVLPDIAARTGAEFHYIPCLLGGIFKATNNQAPWMAFSEIPLKLEYDGLEMQRFIARHGLTKYKLNPHFPVMTLAVMRGAVAADMDGYLMEYVDAMVVAMWEDGLKLDDPEVLGAAWAAAGFDAQKLAAQIADDSVKAKLAANTEAAVARKCFGIPTFYVGDEMFFGKERLGQLEEMLAS